VFTGRVYAYREAEVAEFTEIFDTEATEDTEALQRGAGLRPA
jgi:hypothetical protein